MVGRMVSLAFSAHILGQHSAVGSAKASGAEGAGSLPTGVVLLFAKGRCAAVLSRRQGAESRATTSKAEVPVFS